jgi:Rrf2 family transcriptional regulator, cysteine metabolism repressor
MLFPQKTQYALRAVLELAKRANTGPIKISIIAEAQAIPLRFLEIILNQLKQGGFVDSARGKEGGYYLARSPESLSVGEIITYIQGALEPVDCIVGKGKCPLVGECAFEPMWCKVRQAISGVIDNTTFHDLIETEKSRKSGNTPSYVI